MLSDKHLNSFNNIDFRYITTIETKNASGWDAFFKFVLTCWVDRVRFCPSVFLTSGCVAVHFHL